MRLTTLSGHVTKQKVYFVMTMISCVLIMMPCTVFCSSGFFETTGANFMTPIMSLYENWWYVPAGIDMVCYAISTSDQRKDKYKMALVVMIIALMVAHNWNNVLQAFNYLAQQVTGGEA